MFPYQKGDLCFHVPNTTNNEQDMINGIVNVPNLLNYDNHHANNYLANNNSPSISNNTPNNRKHWSKKSLANGEGNTISNVNQSKIISGNDDTNKRVIHREIERQRRQEMASHFSSLRSILPLEYIKGKRSMSDHIFEATKYIKDLESNVKELGFKRDHLKKTCSSSISTKLQGNVGSTSTNTSSSSKDGCNVSIHTFSKAIEIEICAGIEEDPFPLSKVLKVLSEEGLDVVSCVSSKLNKKWIYVIHCQVDEVASIDSCKLQWRITSEIS
ncbi:transcription factor bHLH118-like [Silene latifolia]|uniref:transcription factor bHLH118-like n=1 Tax=Silene latifolia TaxID=37657 RepID=UPI003D789421